ncbi:MAG: hypothetical protein AAFP76_11780 [Bacteroidota bacterium]
MKNPKKDGHKKDFMESWNAIEAFYSSFSGNWISMGKDALRLIQQMRDLGLDEKLRAGQSLTTFFLSRNRNHGLDKEPHIQISFLGNNKMNVVSSFNGAGLFNEQHIGKECEVHYSGYLPEMIHKLLEQEIIRNEYEDDNLNAFFAAIDTD